MPWTETTRRDYDRRCPRYASDLTDGEWALVEPLIPAPNRIGRPRKTNLREIVNAMLYMASSGCVAASAEGFSAVHDGAELLLALAGRRRAARHQQ